jgi:predicted rRNA methylase YqxC with S4 and FtsJ domains
MPERMVLVSDAWHFRRTASEDDTIVVDVAFISCNTICKDVMTIFERTSSLN